MITVEAAIVIPILLFCCFFVLLAMLQLFRLNGVQLVMLRRLYGISLEAQKEGRMAESFLQGVETDPMMGPAAPGETGAAAEEEAARLSGTGWVRLLSENQITVSREVRSCTERLRRWQLYDDIAEGQGK